MMMKTVSALLCVAIASAATTTDSCTCTENGNYYSPISTDNCGSFTQRTAFLPAETHHCPDGLMFDVETCVCNYPENTYCPPQCPEAAVYKPPKDSCEENGNIYAPVPGTGCAKFTQATDTLPPQEHSCPAGIIFNTDVCVCDYKYRTECNV